MLRASDYAMNLWTRKRKRLAVVQFPRFPIPDLARVDIDN